MDENHPHTGGCGPWGLEAPCCKICLELSSQYYQTVRLGADLSPCWLVHGEHYVPKVLQALRVSPVKLVLYLPFVLVVHVSLLNCSSDLFILSLPRAYQNLFISSHFTFWSILFASFIANISLRICPWICVFIYPMTEVHMFNGSSECYATLLLAPAEG